MTKISEDGDKVGVTDLHLQTSKEEYASEEGLSVNWTAEEEAKAKRK